VTGRIVAGVAIGRAVNEDCSMQAAGRGIGSHRDDAVGSEPEARRREPIPIVEAVLEARAAYRKANKP